MCCSVWFDLLKLLSKKVQFFKNWKWSQTSVYNNLQDCLIFNGRETSLKASNIWIYIKMYIYIWASPFYGSTRNKSTPCLDLRALKLLVDVDLVGCWINGHRPSMLVVFYLWEELSSPAPLTPSSLQEFLFLPPVRICWDIFFMALIGFMLRLFVLLHAQGLFLCWCMVLPSHLSYQRSPLGSRSWCTSSLPPPSFM